jgi:DNA sulfur modification protein DndB
MIETLSTRESLKGFARQQALTEVRQTIKPKELEDYVAEGWTKRKQNSRSVSISREKKRSVLLESRVWSLLYRMGFPLMSGKGGAILSLTSTEDSTRSQVDVVAVDDEVGICVECKSFESPRKEPKFQEKLARLTSLRKPFASAIAKAAPLATKRHIGSVMFTWDVVLTENDEKRAEEAGVSLFDIGDLEYFEALVKLLGPAARFQFLAEVFRGRPIQGLELRVPALRSRMGGLTCYTFAIRPEYLLKVSYIAHRAKGKAVDLDAYQRMISKSRLRKIADYITTEGVFPTNIVVNVEKERYLRFERGKQEGDDQGALFGWLTLSPTYGAAWIIDGQHRLFAYSGHPRASSSYLGVLAFAGLSASKQAQLFVDINSEQRRVKRSLLVELDAVLKWDSEDEDKRINAIISRAGMALDEEHSSPLHDRLLPADVTRTDTRCITLTSLTTALDKPGFFIIAKKKGITEYGPFWRDNPAESLTRTIKILIGWLSPIASAAEEWWALGAGEGGGLAMNNGVTVCLNVLRSVLEHLGESSRLSLLDDADVISRLNPYAKALGNYFARMSIDERQAFRQLQGVDGQTTGTRMGQAALQAEFPKFEPAGLKDWVERRKANTNDQARAIIERMEKTLQDVILETLKEQYQADENQWWFDGVPLRIRTKIQQRIEETDGKAGSREQNFDLIHYREIIQFNWPLFGDLLGYGKQGNKERKTEWVLDVSNMRNTVMHPSRREYLSFEKLAQLNTYWEWLQNQLAKRDEEVAA